jgi:hypothetical protein
MAGPFKPVGIDSDSLFPSRVETRLAETIRDTIGATVTAGTNVTVTVNDAANTIAFATTATVNSTDSALRDRSTHTGTQSADSIIDGTTNKAYTALEKTKLAGVATGATANSTDAALRDRATHTGVQTAATISDLTESVQDIVASLLGAGSNVTLTYNDAANTLSIASTATGGAGLDAEAVRDAIGIALVGVGNISVLVNDAADTITISTTATVNSTDAQLRDRSTHTGVQTADTIVDGTTNKSFLGTERTKLTGIATGATANSTDATLLARANHTGTQSADTLTDGTTNKAFLATERTKLTGIATGATANSSDATLLARANHTGTQAISTVTGLQAAIDAKVTTPAGGTDGDYMVKSGTGVAYTTPPAGGGSGIAGGYGPNWIAASNAPLSIRNAVSAAGGQVCTGTGDQAKFNSQLSAFGEVMFSEGDYYLAASITPSARRKLTGAGPRARLIGASGLTTAFISITADHVWLSDFLMISGAEAANTDHILANVTSSTGFITGADACINLQNLVSQNSTGRGIVMTGSNNRDSKISKIHIHNPSSHGMYISSPDGNFEQVVVGTPGGNGIWMDSGASNWHGVNSKCWYADLDGFLINGIRSTYVGIEGQDNLGAGIRIIGNLLTVSDWLADSNSYDGASPSGVTNVHSGLEVGRTFAQGTSGAFNITIGPGQSWDKNEGSRGFNQRSGVRLRSGIRGLTMTGVGTGNPADTHHNVTGGIEFDTSTDLTHANNFVSASLNHYARMSSI